MLGRTESRDLKPGLPQGELLGNYRTYLDAQKVVDYLADQEFPVQHVSIVGNDLKSVERVTGRLSYPKVALSGAATGAWFGLFVGLLLMLFGGGGSYMLVLSSMAMGAAFWILFGVVSYAFTRGKRDFTSTQQTVATSYDVVVATEVAHEARRLASQLPMPGHAFHPGAQGPGHGQQPQQPQQQQPMPDRPAQWGDPYQQPGQNQPGQNQSGQPGIPPQPSSQPWAGAGEENGGETTGMPVRGRFPDLPDGRPQYGVRISPEHEQGQPDDRGGPSGNPDDERKQDQHPEGPAGQPRQ